MRYLIILMLLVCGCSIKATKDGDTMVLKGWGAKSAKFSDGSEIKKEEPIRIPDISPDILPVRNN